MSGVAQGMSNVELGLRAFLDDLPGRGVPGGCFPIEKQLHLGNHVQVLINQIPHQPAIEGVGGDYLRPTSATPVLRSHHQSP